MINAWGKKIAELAESDDKILLMYGDVKKGMAEFELKFPHRMFNMGLTEQSTLAIAGGLASQGLRPIVFSIAPFILERAFEFVKNDIDENDLPVIMVGYSGYVTHGPTHVCADKRKLLSIFRNVVSYFPETPQEAEQMTLDAYNNSHPTFISLKK